MEVSVSVKTKEEKQKMRKKSTRAPKVTVFYGSDNLTECMRNILMLHMGDK